MTWTTESAIQKSGFRPTSDGPGDIEQLLQGRVSNTALSIHQAKKREGFGPGPVRAAEARPRTHDHIHPPHRHAIEVSDPALDRSDETAVAINPKNPRNIIAGAVSFNGTQFINTAYVTKDRGMTWKTVTVLTDTDEGAGIAFDDSHNCYYRRCRVASSSVRRQQRRRHDVEANQRFRFRRQDGCRGARQDRALRVRSPEHRSLRIHTGWGAELDGARFHG